MCILSVIDLGCMQFFITVIVRLKPSGALNPKGGGGGSYERGGALSPENCSYRLNRACCVLREAADRTTQQRSAADDALQHVNRALQLAEQRRLTVAADLDQLELRRDTATRDLNIPALYFCGRPMIPLQVTAESVHLDARDTLLFAQYALSS